MGGGERSPGTVRDYTFFMTQPKAIMLRKPAAVIAAAWSAVWMLAAAVRFAIVSTTISANASWTRGFLNRDDPIFFIRV